MREHKFRVYCEFEIDGELHKVMESEASWFLLDQVGRLWSYGPLKAPQLIGKEYIKAIPLFYTGLNDKNGKEIYDGDIISAYDREVAIENNRIEKNRPLVKGIVKYEPPGFFISIPNKIPANFLEFNNDSEPYDIIGNIHENPELLENADPKT